MLHYEPSVVALLGAALLVLISKVTVEDALAEIEWETLVFFMGLFIMVGALVETGVIECPLHGAQFDIATGKCQTEIGGRDLSCFAVRIQDGRVSIRIMPL